MPTDVAPIPTDILREIATLLDSPDAVNAAPLEPGFEPTGATGRGAIICQTHDGFTLVRQRDTLVGRRFAAFFRVSGSTIGEGATRVSHHSYVSVIKNSCVTSDSIRLALLAGIKVLTEQRSAFMATSEAGICECLK